MIDYGYAQSELCWGTASPIPISRDTVTAICQGIKAVGGSRVRMGVQVGTWDDLDYAITAATTAGLKPLLCILGNETLQVGSQSNVAAFGALCKTIALRYGPSGTNQVAEYELYNESNNIFFNPPKVQAAQFVEFLKSGYTAIKSVHTSSIVMPAGTVPTYMVWFGWADDPVMWYTKLYDAGAKDYMDAIAMHLYCDLPALPTPDMRQWKYMTDVRALMVARGDSAKKIWVTEVGTSNPGPGITSAVIERDYLKAMVDGILSYDWMGPFYIYSFENTADSPNDPNASNYGIVSHVNLVPKSPKYEYCLSIAGTPSDPDDIVPPTAPTGLAVTSGGGASWDPAVDDVGVTVYRIKDSATNAVLAQTAVIGQTSVQIPGLTQGAAHMVYATALDAAGNESLPSDPASFTTDAPSGLQQAYSADFWTSPSVPTDFVQLGLGFRVAGGVAIPADPLADGDYYTTAPYVRDLQSPDCYSEISQDATSYRDRYAMALVRMSADGTQWVAAFISGGVNGQADAAQIITRDGGVVTVRNARNATPLVLGEKLRITPLGNVYTVERYVNGVGSELVTWTDVDGVYTGAANQRPGIGWRHKRVGSVNYGPPGISAWKAADLNAVQTATGAVEPWMYAIVDPDDWAELTATGSWETLMSSREIVPAAPGPSVPPVSPGPSSFVTRDAGTGFLMLDGDRFRFNGANCANDIGTVGTVNGNAYGGVDHGGSYLTTHTQADALVSSAAGMNLTVLKATWSVHTTNHVDAVQPSLGVFNAAALDPIDYAISICKPLGIRFVLPFCENYFAKPWYCTANGVSAGSPDSSGNYPAPLFYTDATVIAAYKAHISFVLNHVNPYTGVALKDEEQIVCWETGNEFSGPASNAIYAAWVDDIAHHIKVVEGAQQLVQDGAYGVVPESLASTYIDIYDQHTYDQFRTPSFLEAEGAACHAAGKAYFIGEYDWTDDISSSHHPYITHTPYWYLDQMLDSWERSANIDGATFWDLMAPLTIWGDGYTLHYPPDATFNGVSLSEATVRKDMLSDHALRMSVITPKTFVSDTFTGTNGVELSTHVGEVGAAWVSQSAYSGAVSNIQSNRIYGGAAQGRYYSSGVPASADYTVSADIYVASNLGFAGVLARALSLANYSYAAYVWNVGGTVGIFLDYSPPGNIGYHAITTPTVGSTHNIALEVDGGTVSVYWDGALVIGPIAHTARPSAGRAGVIQGGGGSTTTGYHLDNVTATDA